MQKLIILIAQDTRLKKDLAEAFGKSVDLAEFVSRNEFIMFGTHLEGTLYLLNGEDAANSKLLLHFLRKKRPVAGIFIVHENLSLEDMQSFLELGADDFFIKGSDLPLLTLKARHRLERARPTTVPKGISFDDEARLISSGERRLTLTRREYQILRALWKQREKFVSREHILEEMNSPNLNVRNVDFHIHNLKTKLATFNLRIDAEVRGGYRIQELR